MTDSKEPIQGKVARILNSRELALNVGSSDGVQPGMKFDVLTPKGENIKDPDTGEILGSIKRPKVRVQVASVQDSHLSVARTYKKRKINVGGTGGFALPDFSKAMMPPKWVTKYETLKTDETTWEDLDERESFVKTGDPVIQVLSDEDEAVPQASSEKTHCPVCGGEINPLDETVIRSSDSLEVHKRCHEEGASANEVEQETGNGG